MYRLEASPASKLSPGPDDKRRMARSRSALKETKETKETKEKMMAGTARPKILVLGGGFGGLEAALYMRMRMPERADITLVSDQDHFLFRPNTIYIPFGLDPDTLKFRLARPTRRKNIHLAHGRATEIDPVAKHVQLDAFDYQYKLGFDFLIVATGARMRSNDVPGLGEFANTIWTPDEMLRLRAGFQEVVEKVKDGSRTERQRVLFLVPPNNNCSGPLYEMVLMLDTWLRRKKVRESVDITWSTCEESYIEAFGPRLHEVVSSEFERRGITGYNSYAAKHVGPNEVVYRNGVRLPYDLLVSFPPHAASTHFSSLPADDRGFIATELKSRQVVGYPGIYAIGDAADVPVKQAHLAFLQADAAADHLSAQVLGMEPTIEFDPLSLSLIEGFGRTTFAQVPLQITRNADRPIAMRTDNASEQLYKVGSSPLWSFGKVALGVYLPWRFKAGNPFHSGVPWKGMELGLKAMSGLLAH